MFKHMLGTVLLALLDRVQQTGLGLFGQTTPDHFLQPLQLQLCIHKVLIVRGQQQTDHIDQHHSDQFMFG